MSAARLLNSGFPFPSSVFFPPNPRHAPPPLSQDHFQLHFTKPPIFIHQTSSSFSSSSSFNPKDLVLSITSKRDGAIQFTHGHCNTKSTKMVCSESMQRGVVLVRCTGCDQLVPLADYAGWFTDGKQETIDKFFADIDEHLPQRSQRSFCAIFKSSDEYQKPSFRPSKFTNRSGRMSRKAIITRAELLVAKLLTYAEDFLFDQPRYAHVPLLNDKYRRFLPYVSVNNLYNENDKSLMRGVERKSGRKDQGGKSREGKKSDGSVINVNGELVSGIEEQTGKSRGGNDKMELQESTDHSLDETKNSLDGKVLSGRKVQGHGMNGGGNLQGKKKKKMKEKKKKLDKMIDESTGESNNITSSMPTFDAEYVLLQLCGRDATVEFTHPFCNTQSERLVNKEAFHRGVVVVHCGKCDNLVAVADHADWFGDGEHEGVEKFLDFLGMDVPKGYQDSFCATFETNEDWFKAHREKETIICDAKGWPT